MPEQTKLYETWLKQDKTRYNSLNEIEEFMAKYTHQNKKINCIYTYNEENVLSQDIQFVFGGDIYESDIIALSIHNGADARGGFTDYKFFRIDWDQFLNYSREYFEQDDIKSMYQVA